MVDEAIDIGGEKMDIPGMIDYGERRLTKPLGESMGIISLFRIDSSD